MTSNGEEIEEEEISRIEKGQAKNCHGGIETVICTSPSIVCLTQKVKKKKKNKMYYVVTMTIDLLFKLV